ncbi:MAG: GNAT family N-acetyltransferase [Tumebacillaceae bacterium]
MSLKYDDLFSGTLVRLAVPRPEDADVMALWRQNSDYLRHVDSDMAVPDTVAEYKESTKNVSRRSNGIHFRLRTLETDELIGFVALHSVEWNNRAGLLAIGIGDLANRSKGYGSDALHLILRYAFHEMNLNRVGLDVIEYNAGAIRAYEKAGFQIEGRMRSAVLRDGQSFDRIIMGVLRQEWENLQR